VEGLSYLNISNANSNAIKVGGVIYKLEQMVGNFSIESKFDGLNLKTKHN